ncbi:hypothetical protein IE81DRAFT_365994 [Ceraceosorus guamensis]|uniref:HCP-like protein n=1 Tax=Ceraceosorus guamensis TaxID=1522189 RepID=A0A316W339_9BASI|nr:hypothetical protein IE81DRAFT_365994 [Ceraceosorus guamensis]PWN43183.1 hypothetical protein IE81DRAFT_365994 [Ceraceosorus guamensis]
MSRPPMLPPLPTGFGESSGPYPPVHQSNGHSQGPPPLPPQPPGMLQREQQLRQQGRTSAGGGGVGAYGPPMPSIVQPQAHRASYAPGQIISNGAQSFGQRHVGGFAAPSQPMRAPSPAQRPQYGAALQPSSQHQRYHSLQEPSTIHRPASAAPSFGGYPAPSALPSHMAGQHVEGGSRTFSVSHSESMPQGLGGGNSNPVPGFDKLGLGPGAGHHEAGVRRASASEASGGAGHNGSSAQQNPGGGGGGGAPQVLNAPLPDLGSLGNIRDRAMASGDERKKLQWAKQVVKYVERKHDGTRISDPALVRYVDEAISLIMRRASINPPDVEALYLRGDLQASGAFPTYLRKDLKSAFNDFELSARMGYAPSWFRIGRDYEVLNDAKRALDAYNRGVNASDTGCVYRMGMANLLGQLNLPVDHTRAVALLRQAADTADLDTPQPAYIYGMLLAGEFSHVEIPQHLLKPTPDPRNPRAPATLQSEARRRVERSAYLNFAPAQYKAGWSYEYAQLECPFDPLLSVQYYSLASQGGEIEADMALSKWFLCGADGCFDKNEDLAFTFAEKAARKGLASAEFALGYYYEVGVGCEKDVDQSRKWYKRAATQGNTDAKERIEALDGPAPAVLSRVEHEAQIDAKLVRKRTEAKMLSDRAGRGRAQGGNNAGVAAQGNTSGRSGEAGGAVGGGGGGGRQAAHDLSRKRTMRMVEETTGAPISQAGGRGRRAGRQSESAAVPSIPSGPTQQQGRLPQQQQQQHGGAAPPPATNQPGRHGSGYSLAETYAPTATPPRNNAPLPAQQRPSYPSQQPSSSARPSAGRPSAGPPQDLSGPNSGTPSKAPVKVYESFQEMGFAPTKAKDDEKCVIC